MYALFTVTTNIRTNLSGSYSISLLRDDTVVILGDEHDVKRLRQYTIPNGQEVCVVDVNDNLAEITEIKLAGKVCLAISYRYVFYRCGIGEHRAMVKFLPQFIVAGSLESAN